MDWYLLYKTLAPIVLGAVVIYFSFKFPAYYIKDERKDKKKAASPWEIIWALIRTISCCAVFSSIFSYLITKNIEAVSFVTWFSLSAIPSCFGLWAFFEKDAKMTITDRIVQQIQMDKEDKEASALHDERF